MKDLTAFTFFKNTPFTDFSNTVLFESNQERDHFFLTANHYSRLNFNSVGYNYVRDRQSVKLETSYQSMAGVNYCTFLSEIEPNTRYYAYVIEYEYVNDETTRVNLLIDGIMTFCQGNTLHNLKNVKVMRSHLDRSTYNQRLPELRNNDDFLKSYTKKYFHEESFLFKTFDILIQSSADLTADFGTIDDPKMETSDGLTYDKITSPVNLYVVKQSNFKTLMKALAPFPWIAQNLTSISMIPTEMLFERYISVTMESTDFTGLNELRNNSGTLPFLEDELEVLNLTMNNMYSMYGLSDDEKHLLRSEYATAELYTYDGQQLFIDFAQLSESYGITFLTDIIAGYYNEIAIYLKGYKTNKPIHNTVNRKDGSYLNDAIFFRNFDSVPMLINSKDLAMSKGANQRELAESKLVSNRVSSLGDSGTSAKDKFANVASLSSNISVSGMMGKMTDEHEFYRTQKAEFADMALDTPKISEQTNTNSMAIANNFFGLHLKMSKMNQTELQKIMKYYKLFGFELNEDDFPIDLYTNTYCNYIQFKGNWVIDNIDVNIQEMLKAQFEMGVRFWHNNNQANPMHQNILFNHFND